MSYSSTRISAGMKQQLMRDLGPYNQRWPTSFVSLCHHPLSVEHESYDFSLTELGGIMCHKMMVELGFVPKNYEHMLPPIFNILLPNWERIVRFSRNIPRNAFNLENGTFMISYNVVMINTDDDSVNDEEELDEGFVNNDNMSEDKNHPFLRITYGFSPVVYSRTNIKLIISTKEKSGKVQLQAIVGLNGNMPNGGIRHELDLLKYVTLRGGINANLGEKRSAKEWSRVLHINGVKLSSDFRTKFAYLVLDSVESFIRFERSRLTELPPEILTIIFQKLDVAAAFAWMVTCKYLLSVALITWKGHRAMY